MLRISDHLGHGGRPTVQVVPVGMVTGGVGSVLARLEALVIGLAGLAGPPDPATPGGGATLVVETFPPAIEDVLPLDVDVTELVVDPRDGNDASDETGATGVSSREIPLLPSTDPVRTLEIGLHGIGVTSATPVVGLGGIGGAGFAGTWAAAAHAYVNVMQMNR